MVIKTIIMVSADIAENFETLHEKYYTITKTCPCNVYPLEPHFYIGKLGYAGVYLFFLFLLQNIDCGYSLEPPQRGSSNVYPQRGSSNVYPQSMF